MSANNSDLSDPKTISCTRSSIDSDFSFDKCDIYGTISFRRKHIIIDPGANKELKKFSRQVKLKFKSAFEKLENDGRLTEPYGKKLTGVKGLFEIRIKHRGQWRAVYAYVDKNDVVVLTAFAKKTQQTPINVISKARRRLLKYL